MLLEANLHKRLWTYTVMTAVYIRNRCFNSRLGKTPYEALTGKQPNLSNMHVFGSTCYAFVQNAKKLDDRSRKGVFVGYDKDSPAYLVYHPETNKVEKLRCVKFFDNFKTEPEASNDDHDEKYIYAVKIGQNGEETHKARYVAKGYSQIPEIDYKETFAPTARMSSIRTLLQRVVQNDMIIHQMDVKTAYLNAPIDCELYMEQPEGFEEHGENGEKLVCKLNKSLYGLKRQSGRNWNNLLHEYLQKEGFTQSQADPCVYVIIWVDDIIIAASNFELL